MEESTTLTTFPPPLPSKCKFSIEKPFALRSKSKKGKRFDIKSSDHEISPKIRMHHNLYNKKSHPVSSNDLSLLSTVTSLLTT